MDVQPDFRELLALLNSHDVDYVVVGAYALAFHGAPRATGDLDILVGPGAGNANSIMAALEAFGFGDTGLQQQDFEQPDQVVQLGVPPVRVDILTSITGVSWDAVRRGRVEGRLGDVPVHFLGLAELRENKRALGRRKDLADLEALGEED